MALLPRYLNFFRKIVHKVRRVILGPDWQRSSEAGAAIAALDRLAVLESQVNWRLLGLPARVENLKMEQLPLLADGKLAETSLARLREFENPPIGLIDGVLSQLQGNICAVSSCYRAENEIISRHKVKLAVIDPTDVFRFPEEASLGGEIILNLPIIDAAARWTRPEFDQIWLSNCIERLTPLQQQVLFLQAVVGLKPGGRLAGYFADHDRCDAGAYWSHPSRLRPVTKALITRLAKGAGFEATIFEDNAVVAGVAHSVFLLKL